MNALLDEALACLRRGWSVLPVHAGNDRDKDPHSPLLARSGLTRVDDEGRVRATWKPLQDTRPTEEQVRSWFARPDEVGLALVTGRLSGRIVVDFDGDEGRAYAHALGISPHVRTGGGYHWHLHAPDFRVRNLVGKQSQHAPACIDIRGDGGNAILPPTRTRKGQYVWLRDPEVADEVSALPPVLREALGLVRPVQQQVQAAYSGPLPSGQDRFPAQRILDWALQRASTGHGRNDTGYRLAWALYNNGYGDDEVLRVGDAYVQSVGGLKSPPYTADEFRASARSAKGADRGEPWGAPQADGFRPARTSAEAFEEIYAQLSPEEQTRGASLLARELAHLGRSVEHAVTYLRLIGHQGAAQTVRRAYVDHEQARPVEGTLTAFLAARRVRTGRGIDDPPRGRQE